MTKKAELQIMETIIVVIIIIVMILIGMVFFYRYMMAGIDADNKEHIKSLFDSSIFTFPQQAEVTCSQAGMKESCLDTFKMIGFSQAVLKKKTFYQGIYGFRNITVEIVYPKPTNRKICTKETAGDCAIYNLYLNVPSNVGKDKRVRTTPVSIYMPDKKQYAIGILTITGYGIGV